MLETILYFSFLVIFFVFFVRNNNSVLGVILLFSYSVVAGFSVALCYNDVFNDKNVENVTFVPYLFLMVSYFLFFSPFLSSKYDLSSSKIIIDVNRLYVFFAVAYIIFSIVRLIAEYPTLSLMLSVRDWAQTYNEETSITYSNKLEYVSILFTNYTRMLAWIVGFVLFSYRKNGIMYKVVSLLLILFSSLTQISSAIICTSRSMLFELFLIMPAMYGFFYQDYSKSRKNFANTMIFLLCSCVVVFFLDVTVSRFESRGTFDSIISYVGQSPIVFNTQVFGKLNTYLCGDYTMGILYGIKNVNPASIGGLWGTRFYTFVGWLYMDWGVVGVLIIGLVNSFFFYFYMKKKNFTIADVYLFFSYYLLLIKGVFVIGRSYIISLIASMTIFALLKISERDLQYPSNRKVY